MIISVKKLTKTYRTKKMPPIEALKGISFDLPEKGLVFVLGKSGCGKSTLLNLLGGLDGFDGGDIVIDGKSLKNYSGKEYEQYRNYKVGFVFQENNLFDEYTVEYNIGMALALQGDKNYGERIAEVLKAVELEEYAKTKPNCLSGGQKQRVAIARAIVKSPELLLCDEPTDALDFETGETIFELLKEISKTKLVLVVSHDRDSAAKYADRVIELKSGNIVSDSGASSSESLSECKASASREADNQKLTDNKPETKKKSCGFSAKTVISMGAGILVARPVRLALCLIICLITFTCIGVAGALNSYDRHRVIADTMQLYGTSHLSYHKFWSIYENEEPIYNDSFEEIDDNDIADFKSVFGNGRIDKIYNYAVDLPELPQAEYKYNINGFVVIDDDFAADYNFDFYGEVPQDITEVVVTDLAFYYFQECGYMQDGEQSKLEDISDYNHLIGKQISLYQDTVTIVGIIDTKFDIEYFRKYLFGDPLNNGNIDETVQQRCWAISYSCLYNMLFVHESFIDANARHGIGGISAPMPRTRSGVLKALDVENYSFERLNWNNDKYYEKFIVINDAVRMVDDITTLVNYYLKPLLFWVSIGLSVVSALLVMYYASGVVSEKEREVGILRALGATKGNIFKIFGAANGLFAGIVIVVSSILSVIGVTAVDNLLTSRVDKNIVAITFGFVPFIILSAVAICAVVVGYVIPMLRLIIKKPVDVIAGRKQAKK